MLHLFLCSVIFLACAESQQTDFFCSLPGSTLAKYDQFIASLTSPPASQSGPRYVHSSGGAAGGVISEGQGYGIFAASVTAAIIGPSHARYNSVVDQAYNLFLGWKQMCLKSTSDGCQNPRYCTSGSSTVPCLPHWKFTDDLSSPWGTGSAPDGDEDAILGMIILARLTQNAKPAWWTDLAKWTYQSCKQFYQSETVAGASGTRIVKLGACWGGWDCQNPSYHAPFAYKAMRDFMKQFGSQLGFTDGLDYVTKWNQVIDTSYAILASAQCGTTGLIPNWYVPNSNPTIVGTTGCSGSGTPSEEFGAEASRAVWRVAIDYIWTKDPRAKSFLAAMGPHIASKFQLGANLNTGCLVKSIFNGWLSNAFMYGPTLTSLVNPHASIAGQQNIINNAASKINGGSISDYYSGSWTILSLMVVNGDLAKITSLVTGGSVPPAPVAVPKPVAPVPVAPKPVAVPITAPKPVPVPVTAPKPVPVGPVSCANLKYGDVPTNNWYIVIAGATVSSTVKVKCSDNSQHSCTWNPTWGRHTCNPTTECKMARSAVVNGVTCALDPNIIARKEEDSAPTSIPAFAIALIVVGSVCVICAILGAIFYITRPAQEERV